MANRALILALGISLLALFTGCKEGKRQNGLDPGQCLRTNAAGQIEVFQCDGGQMNQPDATADASGDGSIPDGSIPDGSLGDGAVGDAMTDASLPDNACLPDLQKVLPFADAGVDGGGVPLLVAAFDVAFNTDYIFPCAASGFGPGFISCLASSIANELPALSPGCPECYAGLTECAVSNCAFGENDQCLFADQSNPTLEELAECNRCRCDNGCNFGYDECSGLGMVPPASANAACIPQGDGCLADGALIGEASGAAAAGAATCLGMGLDPSGWAAVVCIKDQVVANTTGGDISNGCATCLAQQTQCLILGGCAAVCSGDPGSDECISCACTAGCNAQFDGCSGFDFSAACSSPDAGAGDAAADAGV